MFLLKKIISPFLSPLTVCLGFLLIGLIFLWFTQKRKYGLILVSIGTLSLVLMSYGPLPNALLGFLEYQNPALLSDKTYNTKSEKIVNLPKWIVVLGGGTHSDQYLPANSQLSLGSLSRLIEAIRIQKMYPNTKLIIAGGPIFGQPPDSESMAKVAHVIGVPEKDTILITDARDTKDQARRVRSIVGNDQHILVTSASHMPRALALFRKLGMRPIAAPTNYLVKRNKSISPGKFFPNASSIKKMEVALHEYIGIIWAKIRKLI